MSAFEVLERETWRREKRDGIKGHQQLVPALSGHPCAQTLGPYTRLPKRGEASTIDSISAAEVLEDVEQRAGNGGDRQKSDDPNENFCVHHGSPLHQTRAGARALHEMKDKLDLAVGKRS